MNPYLLTLSFLMLMSLITSSEVSHFAARTTGMGLYQNYLASNVKKEAVWTQALMDDFHDTKNIKTGVQEKRQVASKNKGSSSEQCPDPLRFDLERPPNNARLNLYLLLHEKPALKVPQGFSLYEVTAQLMRKLYEKEPFFQVVPRAEYEILDLLIEKRDESKDFAYPDELSSISFQNPTLQDIFYKMLKGTAQAPSLLNYVTFDREGSIFMRRINLMFVSPTLLEVIFPQETVREEILSIRTRLWEEIIDQEEHRLERTKNESKNRSNFKDELQSAFKATIKNAGLDVDGYKQLFDFSLGKRGNVFFIIDPETKGIKREKYQPHKKEHPKKIPTIATETVDWDRGPIFEQKPPA
ncbi:MAG: hypothetical protein WAM28_06115 [Chlamydiales bacterium]